MANIAAATIPNTFATVVPPATASLAGLDSNFTSLLTPLNLVITKINAISAGGFAVLASAATVNIGGAAVGYVQITGVVTITAFDNVAAGTTVFVEFAGALTLTQNATSLILPGATNITTAAGDTAIFISEGGGNWRCISYTKASGAAVKTFTSTQQTITSAGALTLAHGLGAVPFGVGGKLHCVTGEAGFTAGQEIDFAATTGNAVLSIRTDDGTNLIIRYGNSAGVFVVAHATTGVATSLTNGNWTAIFRAWL